MTHAHFVHLPARRALFLLVASLVACAPRPQELAREEAGPPPAAPAAAPAAEPLAGEMCRTAACWSELAQEFERREIFDVAAGLRARAFAQEPGAAALAAWIDALVAAGAPRSARAALEGVREDARRRGDAILLAQIEERLKALPASPEPDLVGAERLVQRAGSLVARGEVEAARTLWAQARARFHEAGATVRLTPVETWMTHQVRWLGDQLLLVRRWSAQDDYQTHVGALELWPAAASAGPTRRLLFSQAPEVVALSDDGATLVRAEGEAVVLQDMSSGAALRRIEGVGRVLALAAAGSGDDLHVLVGGERETTLWSARGERRGRFALAGTTPTITRVYHGGDTLHDNILDDVTSWPVSLAIAPGARMVAIGGSDSKVRVFDVKGGAPRVLEYRWQYTEHRHMGGNPDLNTPLDLRFRAGGDELVAVYAHGDLFVWDPRRGKALRRWDGACDVAEATAVVNRYGGPNDPQRTPTDDERAGCGHAHRGVISPDGTIVATHGGGLRLRSAVDGRSLGMLVDSQSPNPELALSSAGALAVVDLYGAIGLVRPGARKVEVLRPPEPSGPIDPWISSQGRFLQFGVRPASFVWDLQARRRIEVTRGPKEHFLALANDGRHVAVHTGDAVEIRDVGSGATVSRTPMAVSTYAVNVQFAAGCALIAVDELPTAKLVTVDLATGEARHLALALDGLERILSPDGRWLAELRRDQPMRVWDMTSRLLAHSLDKNVRHAAFARDGSFVVWLAEDAPGQRRVRVKLRRLDRPADAAGPELALEGWPGFLAVAPDGAEVMILLQDGLLTRWRPGSGEHATVRDTALISARRVHVADDRRTLLLEGYDQVQIRGNDAAATPLATLYPLLSGGWMAISRSGALDGSADAPRSLMTRVFAGGGEKVFEGEFGWDGAHLPGVLGRALAGEDSRPPAVAARPPEAAPAG